MSVLREISGWARWPRRACLTVAPDNPDAIPGLLNGASAIARGLGRAYGDSAMNPDCTILTRRLNRILEFQPETGEVVAEAGVSFKDLIETFLPRGFFPSVTPGSKFVTLGGAIAADVHGKNHHVAGSFGDHILWFDLVGADGKTRRCSPQENPELFGATLGGMGLTGIVTRAAIRLMPVETGWIKQKTVVAPDLDTAIECFENHLDVTYSVAWIDCLATGASRGRMLVYLGEHARREDLTSDKANAPYHVPSRRAKRVPFDAPSWTLNSLSVRTFNYFYFQAGKRAPESQLIDWDSYFYPLDALLDWNRIYGTRGFAEYQCALPLATSRDGLVEMLDVIADSGLSPFLAVTKRLGPGSADRPLSFPIEGYTLALDFPLSSTALTLMDRLDEILLAAGGQLYLAKDSRMTRETFEQSYGTGRTAFAELIAREAGPLTFASLQSRRLGL